MPNTPTLASRIIRQLNEASLGFKTIGDPEPRPAGKATRYRRINDALHGLPTYSTQIPLSTIFDICKRNGFQPVQEDGTPWAGFLTGREGKATIELKDELGKSLASAVAWLHLTWYRMEQTGKYEIIAYVN